MYTFKQRDKMNVITVRKVQRTDVDACAELERVCYSGIEAATREYLAKRIEVYPDGFFVAEVKGVVVGMINSGATHKDDITDEELKNLIGHVRNGRNGVIFSVAVHPDFRLRGVAKKLIDHLIRTLEEKQKQRILLLCKENLVEFYASLGFGYSGRSASTFGGFTWHQMQYELPLPGWMVTEHHNPATLTI